MGNPHKGEVEFTVDKKVYTLKFSINAMCMLEDALGGNIVELANLMSDPGKISMKTVRSVFWAGLCDHHEAVTVEFAGRLIDALGLPEAVALVAKAFTLAFPEVQANVPLASNAAGASTGATH